MKRICEDCGEPVDTVRITDQNGMVTWSGYTHTGPKGWPEHDPAPVWVDAD